MKSNKKLIEILMNISKVIQENKQILTDLDAAIGDGDHGLNMSKGFKAFDEKASTLVEKDCGSILKTLAMTLISTVGGASGPLYGTAFLKASIVVNGKMILENEDILKMFEEMIGGIKMRGKGERGEKTMLDSIIPAYDSLKESFGSGKDVVQAFRTAAEQAFEGVEFTKTIKATKGRASYLGDRSIGHQDPGATSSYLMINAVYETLKKLS